MFRKKAIERMLTKMMWDHVIDLKKEFVPKKEKVYLLSRKESKEVRRVDKKEVYSTVKVTTDCTSILGRKKGWEEENGTRLLVL